MSITVLPPSTQVECMNAEVDSMGGVIDNIVGFGFGLSPQHAAIEKAQADLRREYDVREDRKRELEFLEKGGNPLDFSSGNASCVSVQSTSLTDQPSEPIVTSEAKGSFALTASPHGDSVESSGRPEALVVSESNCADNLLLFDGKNDSVDGGRNSLPFVRSKISSPEQTSQLNSSQKAKISDESAVFGLPKSRAYKRRKRSRPSCEGARSSSTDIVPSLGDHVSSLPSSSGQKDMKDSGLISDNQQNQNISMNYNSKPTFSNGTIAPNDLRSDGVVDMILDSGQVVESITNPTEAGLPKLVPDSEKSSVNNQRPENVAEKPTVASEIPESLDRRQLVVSHRLNFPADSTKPDKHTGSVQYNGFLDAKSDEIRVPDEGQSYCATETSLSLDRTAGRVPSDGLRNEDIKENTGEEILNFPVSPSIKSHDKLNTKNNNKADDRYVAAQDEQGSRLRPEEVLHESGSGSQEGENHTLSVVGMEVDGITASEIKNKPGNLSTAELDQEKEKDCSGRLGVCRDKSAHDNPSTAKKNASNSVHSSVFGLLSQTALPSGYFSDTNKDKISIEIRTHEDAILKEARFIEAKRKRIAQLAAGAFTSKNHHKSHWDFVLEEMAWLANDFVQERLWKISAAGQLSHQIASSCRKRLAEKSSLWKQKKVAHTLSKAIVEFWLLAEEVSKGKTMKCPKRNSVCGVQEYAVRYLRYNTSLIPLCLAEAPVTPERISDLGSQELSWEEQLTEENLFYTVPPEAVETYRKAIESHMKNGSSIQEEVETSIYDAAAGNAFEEDEGETNTHLSTGDMESGKPSKFAQKKRILIKSSSARLYTGTDLPSLQHMEKGPASNVHVSSIPTKRIRTASRPRFTAPFTAETSTGSQVPNKTDASSGDTNSFQDDQSTFLGGSQVPNNIKVESGADFGRQLPYDSVEVSKPKIKKKPKHLGSSHKQRWQLDNNFQNELDGDSRKRFDKQAESNGSSGLFGQHIMKKQKMMRQPVDNFLNNSNPLAGSIPSHVASQMSNMSNSNKLIKILGGHRGIKSRSLKMPVGQRGTGSSWSSFEEQALIVLVHDLGPNWDLISDAINNILQYKCIFRKPKDCSEHYKELISRTAGDGADSAEDSGSSQPYPPTLPGIPKGSARALFQRLQEPIEGDMIKFHFEKIIVMSQKLHYIKMQNENQEQKPIQPHSSHTLALSQVCPNNVDGGPVLTPLDLCDATVSSTDVLSSGYQGTHGNNIPSPSTPVNSAIRDGRYGGPRSASLPADEHQRGQQYKEMMPGRVSGTPLGTDSGRNKNMTLVRPGFPGITTSSVLNSGSTLSPNMAGPSNMHSWVGPGNTMLRPPDSLNMMRPAQILEHQRQMMAPNLQMPATQGNIQGVPSFLGPSGGLNHPYLRGPNHVSSPQHQAYAIHFAKERQLQLQQHLTASNGMMPRGPSQPQSSMKSSPHTQPQTSVSESTPLTPSSSLMSPHGLTRNLQSGGNQMGKQRQRQSQQHAKLVKGHQTRTADPSILNDLCSTTGSQFNKKAEQVMKMMQGEGLYPGSIRHHHLNKHLDQQKKLYSGQEIASPKQVHQLPSHMDDNNKASPSTSNYTFPNSQEAASPMVRLSSNPQPTQKLGSRSQPPVQKTLQQNHKLNSESFLLNASQSSSPSQLRIPTVRPQPSVEQDGVNPLMSSTSDTQLKISEQQNSNMPKSHPLTSLGRTKSHMSEEGQAPVTLPTQGINTGAQRQQQQAQLQMSSSPPLQEKHPLPAQQLQAGNINM